MKVLAIDDLPDNLRSLRAVLAEVLPDAFVLSALNGPKGLELARSEDPTVILLDIVMPGMDGFEVCRRLKADEHLREIPVIFLTAQSDRASRMRALEVGGEAFLAKPLDAEEVAAQVRAMVKIREAGRQAQRAREQLEVLVAARTTTLEQELAQHRQTMASLQQVRDEMQGNQIAMLNLLEDQQRLTVELRGRDEQFQAITAASPDALIVTRLADGLILYCNEQFARLVGLPLEAVRGSCAASFYVNAEDRRRLVAAVEAETEARMELLLKRADGSPFWSMVSAAQAPFRGEMAVYASLRDITDQKQAEAALTRSEAELAAIHDHTPVMLLLIDGNLQVRRLNRAASALFGSTLSEGEHPAPGTVLGCVRALDDPRGCGYGPQCAVCLVRRALLDTLATGTSLRRLECVLRSKRRDELIDVHALLSTAKFDVVGESLVLLCLEDVSEQRLAEHRVREQAALLDVTDDAILVLDFDGRITYWNRGAEQLYGWRAEEVAGRSVAEVLSGDWQTDAAAAMRRIRASGSWNGELRQQTRRGTTVVTNCRGVLMVDRTDKEHAILLTASDVTENKRLEAQYLRAQRLETLGSLASGIAHDLNNVFTPIMMSVEFLRGLSRSAADGEMLRLLEDSTRRGSDIVRQLLVFGRGTEAPSEGVRIPVLLEELRRMLRETFPKNIVVSMQAPADVWAVDGNSTQLHQVLLNLCINARDAMPQGGKLEIRAENRHVDETTARANLGAHVGPYVWVRVTDNGGGIAPENIERIFDPFFTTKPVGEGTGLGLPTVLQIVHGHGGFVSVRSEPGAGSEFSVYLPRQSGPGELVGGAGFRPASGGQGELVLVVDDEQSILSMIKMALETSGYAVMTAADGWAAEALCSAHGAKLRLLITDMMMPGIGGLDTIRKVRAILPQLPVVAISGLHNHQLALEQLPPPRVCLLKKPFTVEMIRAEVRQALDALAASVSP